MKIKDLEHKNDGLYDTSTWVIDQTKLEKSAEPLKKKKQRISHQESHLPRGSYGTELAPLVRKDDEEVVGMEDEKHVVDTRANKFFGDKSPASPPPVSSPSSSKSSKPASVTSATYNPLAPPADTSKQAKSKRQVIYISCVYKINS